MAGGAVARWWQVTPAAAPTPGRRVGHSSRGRGGLLLTKVSSELKVNPVVISSIVEVLYRQWSEGVLNGKGRNKRMVRRDEGNRMQEL